MSYWIAADLALDSEDDNIILGIFTDEAVARQVADDHKKRYKAWRDDGTWWEREFCVFEVSELNVVNRLDYESRDPYGRYVSILR